MPADFLSASTPLDECQVALYVTALSHRRVRAAQTLVASVLHAGATPTQVRLQLFQPALREIGDLFQAERLSLSACDFILEATQWLMARLPTPPPRAHDAPRPRLTLGCVPGETHGLGARMVAGHFQEDGGWEVTLLKPGLTEEEFVAQVAATLPDLTGISVTMEAHLPAAGALVRALRRERTTHPIPVIVGGLPFLESASLRRVVLADLYGRDAADGLTRAEQFLARRGAALRPD